MKKAIIIGGVAVASLAGLWWYKSIPKLTVNKIDASKKIVTFTYEGKVIDYSWSDPKLAMVVPAGIKGIELHVSLVSNNALRFDFRRGGQIISNQVFNI